MEANKITDDLFDDIKKYLYYKKYKIRFIKRGYIYTVKDIEKLKSLTSEYHKGYIGDILETSNNNNSMFISEYKCTKCLNIKTEKLSRESFINLIYIGMKCGDCIKKEYNENIEIQLKQQEKLKIEHETNKQANTIIFIEMYLKNNYTIKDTPYSEYNQMNRIFSKSNMGDIVSETKKLNYKIFLNTVYWKIISRYKKYKSNNKCELCYKDFNLHVHHKTYNNHGFEIDTDIIKNDLIVLCNQCHSHHHHKLHKEE
jgi:hypothetical protein